MKIELTPSQEDKVVRKSLEWVIANFINERERVIATGKGFVFSIDQMEDILILTKHIDAAILIHNYYSAEEQKTMLRSHGTSEMC